jgi:hypothetical protein
MNVWDGQDDWERKDRQDIKGCLGKERENKQRERKSARTPVHHPLFPWQWIYQSESTRE